MASLREIILLSLGALFGLGATITSVAVPALYPNVPQWVWHWAFWGGIAIMLLIAIDTACLSFWHPRASTALFFNVGLLALAAAGISQTAPLIEPSVSKIQTIRQAFSSTQSIKLWPPFLGGNEIIHLDNVATLRALLPLNDRITLALNIVPIRFKDLRAPNIEVEGAQI